MGDGFSTSSGETAGILTELTRLRDFLTERYLRPVESSRYFSPLALESSWRRELREPYEWSGLSGIGVGYVDDEPGIIFFAAQKREIAINLWERLREWGVPVDYRDGVSFTAASRPVRGGESIGYGSVGGASGTMGCVVRSRASGECFALTCNHVIADLNLATKGSTEVWAPGVLQAGTAKDRLGVVYDFADLDFAPNAINIIDAALARPDNPYDLDPIIDRIGPISGTNYSLGFGDRVKKTGVGSGQTDGKYRFSINCNIGYVNGSFALFYNLIGIVSLTASNFGAPEDSGAIVLDDRDAAVGQVVSTSSGIDLTLATPIKPVLDHFQVDIV